MIPAISTVGFLLPGIFVAHLTERLPLQTPAPVELLVEMLNQRPDQVYMRSLGAAADLLKAFR